MNKETLLYFLSGIATREKLKHFQYKCIMWLRRVRVRYQLILSLIIRFRPKFSFKKISLFKTLFFLWMNLWIFLSSLFISFLITSKKKFSFYKLFNCTKSMTLNRYIDTYYYYFFFTIIQNSTRKQRAGNEVNCWCWCCCCRLIKNTISAHVSFEHHIAII